MGRLHDLGASIIMALSLDLGYIPYVMGGRPYKLLKRFPGGKLKYIMKNDVLCPETPQECAVRELREETGYIITVDAIIETIAEDKGDHTRYFCYAEIDTFVDKQMRRGSSGERCCMQTPQQGLYGDGFLIDHREVAKEKLLNAVWRNVHEHQTP